MSSSASPGRRNYLKEMQTFINKRVTLTTITDKTYSGELGGLHPDTFSCVLLKARDDETKAQFHKIFINGNQIKEIFLEEAPFDLRGLAMELEKIFRRPGDVKIYEEAGLIVVLERVRVSEDGVEGTGPVADRVQSIYERYVVQQKKAREEEDEE